MKSKRFTSSVWFSVVVVLLAAAGAIVKIWYFGCTGEVCHSGLLGYLWEGIFWFGLLEFGITWLIANYVAIARLCSALRCLPNWPYAQHLIVGSVLAMIAMLVQRG